MGEFRLLLMAMALIAICVLTVRSQDSWESYEDYSEEHIVDDFDIHRAKEEFCFKSNIREHIISCLQHLDLPDYLDKWALMCLPSLGINQTDVAEILEEVCKPETDINLGRKLRECMVMKMREKKYVSKGIMGTQGDDASGQLYHMYCDAAVTSIMNRNWLMYFYVIPGTKI